MKNQVFERVMLMTLLVLMCGVTAMAEVYQPVSTSALSSWDVNAPIGWATVDGTVTGSGDKNPVTVTTLSELQTALSGTDAKTIYVSGTIAFTGSVTIEDAANKTVYGLPGSCLSNTTHTATVANTGILTLKNCSNIIIRNLTFMGAGAYDVDGHDNLTLQNCSYMWIDHCDFQDGVDGNLDCNNGSDYICVSWCRFRYLIDPWSGGSGGSNDHRFTNLWGGSDGNAAKDEGKLNTTFYACWWDDGCRERMPRVRFGKIHILNCLYSSTVANYCVGAGYSSNIYVENSAFTSTKAQKTPWKSAATSSGYTDYNITMTGCSGASDVQTRSGSIDYFTPSYTYTAHDASSVQTEVSAHAGATLTFGEDETFKNICINLTDADFAGNVAQWTAINTGIAVDGSGNVSKVAVGADNAVGTIAGKWHGTTYGWAAFTASIPVPQYVKITYGTNNYGSEVTITDASSTKVATINNNASQVWSKSNPDRVVKVYYTGEATTLNFSSCAYVGYFAVEKMTQAEIEELANQYTLTYYDTDGTTVLGTQKVASNAAITAFSYDGAEPTVAAGKTFRGWFATSSGGKKYFVDDIVTSDMSLYAVATTTETASESETYTFDLRDPYFYAEDHEAFNVVSGSCSYNGAQHGWSVGNNTNIDLLVGSKAVISITLCQHGNGTNILVKKGDETLATLAGKAATDGETVSYNYVGEAGTLRLVMEKNGYIHQVQVVNYGDAGFTKDGQWYLVEAGNAGGFTKALAMANAANGNTTADRSYVFLPNGTYDLGTTALTTISGHNISIIGESSTGTMIKNTPEQEGISVTATLLNTGTNNYLQDLTLKCTVAYDDVSEAERGVCLQDRGSKTICRNVVLDGRQDSYYCNNSSGQYYFEGGTIKGTVDYICGNGDVYFNRVSLYNQNRSSAGVIAAPNTLYRFGYIFNNCTISGDATQDNKYLLGRPWAASGTKVLFVNTTMNQLPAAAGWGLWNDHSVSQFAEYQSVDQSGNAVDVSSRLTTIGGSNDPVIEIAEAADYMVDQVSWDDSWQPWQQTILYDAPAVAVDGTTASWDAVDGASAYALYDDGTLVGVTTSTSYTVDGEGTYTLRVANAMGGFGDVTGTTPSVSPTIGAAGYATYASDHALDFSSATGVKAYVATSAGDGAVVMSKVTGAVPAYTGLILQKTDGDIVIPVVPNATAPATNLLKPSVYQSVVAASGTLCHYVFAKQNGSIGFYNLASAADVTSGKAYLETESSISSARLNLVFEETTGISTLNAQPSTLNVYDLFGRRVAQPQKGLYIVNGRKVIVK